MSSETRITFGPPGEEWHYSPASKTYDLSAGAQNGLTIPTTEGPEASVKIAPDQTALVVVDMQNFFLDPSCMAHPNGLKAVEPTIKVIEKCRDLGIQVIWLNWGLTDTDMLTMPAGVQRGFMKDILQSPTLPPPPSTTAISSSSSPSSSSSIRPFTGLGSPLGDSKGRCLFANTWNADIYPPLKAHVHATDVHCPKNRMSGLWTPEQPLWKALKSRAKNTILFTGVNTDQCVLGTFVDGYNAGWNCILVDDCCGTTTGGGGREVTLYNIANSYGFVTDSRSFLSARVV